MIYLLKSTAEQLTEAENTKQELDETLQIFEHHPGHDLTVDWIVQAEIRVTEEINRLRALPGTPRPPIFPGRQQ